MTCADFSAWDASTLVQGTVIEAEACTDEFDPQGLCTAIVTKVNRENKQGTDLGAEPRWFLDP